MSRINFNEIDKYNGGEGSSAYFSLKDKESAMVRILYNNYEDVVPFVVHTLRDGNKTLHIDCPRNDGDALDTCDYCKEGNKPVVRVVVPLFNENTGRIEYWMRSGSYVNKDMKMVTDLVVQQGKPIASQQYMIRREGEGLDTKYAIIPTSISDDKTKDSFGEIKDPIKDLHMIKEAGYKPEETVSTDNGNFAPRQPQQMTSTRKTSEIF